MIVSPYRKPYFSPPPAHPRLLLTEKDFPRIRENLVRQENAVAAATWRDLLTVKITATGATPAFSTYNLKEALAVEALAFRALLSGEKGDAEAAIDAICLLLDTFTVTAGNMGARWGGHLIFVAAEVYDWCYGYISQETRQKMIAACERMAADYFEMKYPPVKQTAVSGHGMEAQLLRDLLAFSVAVYDERPDIYDFCAGRIFDEYVPSVARLFAGGAHNQGPSYGSYRFVSLAWGELILRAINGGRPVFDHLEKLSDWFYYMTRPDGEDVRLGDDFNETKALYNRRAPFTVPFFFSYALTGRQDFYDFFKAGFCRTFLLPERHGIDYYDEGSWGEGLLSPVSMLIFDRFSKARPAAKLPNARYFGTPVGETVFKAGNTHILMKAGEYWGANHDHLDTGCFQVFCGVPLVTDSGVYDSYASPHRRQYLTRTSAHNCLTVERTDGEKFGEFGDEIEYDGGTRRPAAGKEPKTVETLLSDEYRMATVLSHTENEGGATLVADLSPAYCHACERVVRSMAYDHEKRTLTVRDEVTALDAAFKKTFHLHFQAEPTVAGNTITVENGGFRAVCRVVLPKQAEIVRCGGAGRQFTVNGKNFPPTGPYVAEAGWGEVRISPKTPAKHDVFLVEITTFSTENRQVNFTEAIDEGGWK